jgi:hypothetical protein
MNNLRTGRTAMNVSGGSPLNQGSVITAYVLLTNQGRTSIASQTTNALAIMEVPSW